MTQKERIQNKLSKKGFYAEKLTKRKGIWTFKKSYFYHYGMSAEEAGAKIEEALPRAKVLSVVNEWNCWGERSWFIVKFKMEEEI